MRVVSELYTMISILQNLIMTIYLSISMIFILPFNIFIMFTSVLLLPLKELPLAFLIMWIFQQQNPSALDYLRNSTLPSFLKYRFTGYRILVNRFSFFFFLSAPYKCYPIAFWPPSFLLKSLLPKLKELPLSDTSFFS